MDDPVTGPDSTGDDRSALEARLLETMSAMGYKPARPRILARNLGLDDQGYRELRQVLRALEQAGRVTQGPNKGYELAAPATRAGIPAVFAKDERGREIVRLASPDNRVFRVKSGESMGAKPGDEVLVRLVRARVPTDRGARTIETAKVVGMARRQQTKFVGTVYLRDGEPRVRLDGAMFSHSVRVGDLGAKGAKPGDMVVVEIINLPMPGDPHGSGVILEVLGQRGELGVDLLAVIRSHELPVDFPPSAEEEAHRIAQSFSDQAALLLGREDFTADATITIDPVDAKDFDDAVWVSRDARGHWLLKVHIADVGALIPAGGPLDREARNRATSVYLPGKVIPMIPESISNAVASLQEGQVRLVQSVLLDMDPEGRVTRRRFVSGAIKVAKRLAYEQAQELIDREATCPDAAEEALRQHLLRMRDLSAVLNRRRHRRGCLELQMPEARLDFDEENRVSGAHWRQHLVAHSVIEEFMLAANEAVAEELETNRVPFLHRSHPDPDPYKLRGFGRFVGRVGYTLDHPEDRFEVGRLLERTKGKPEGRAIHFALLRSMKKAVYSAEAGGHYALAARYYCHFTSPIRRYPDLVVHRQLTRWHKEGRAGFDQRELESLADHCSHCERRAEAAERELVKRRILAYLADRQGEEYDAVITGVADYGIFAQGVTMPFEGRVHISALGEDWFSLDEDGHELTGRRGKRFRLGDAVRVSILRVDQERLHLDLKLVGRGDRDEPPEPNRGPKPKYPIKTRRPKGGGKGKKGGRPGGR